MSVRKKPQDMTAQELFARIESEKSTLNSAYENNENEGVVKDIKELIDALQSIYDMKFLKKELREELQEAQTAKKEIEQEIKKAAQESPKSAPSLSGLSAKSVQKKDNKETVKTRRIQKSRYFEKTQDMKKFKKLVVRLQVKLLGWYDLKKKDAKRVEYVKLVTEYTQDIVDFVNARAVESWKEYLLNDYNQSACCSNKKQRFTLKIDKTLKDFKL